MYRVCRIGLFASLTLCFFLGAFANSAVNLSFVNVGPGNTAGGAYAYPYNFSINGSGTLTPMMCDAYNNHINFGESWTADVHSIPQGPRLQSRGADFPERFEWKRDRIVRQRGGLGSFQWTDSR